MSLASLFFLAQFYTLFGVLGAGFSILALCHRCGIIKSLNAERSMMLVLSFGILWGAVWAALVYASTGGYSSVSSQVKITADLCLLVAAFFFARGPASTLLRSLFEPSLVLFALAGVLLGAYAFFQFPSVQDSGQLIWTQRVLLDSAGALKPMLGFTGVFVWLATLVDGFPVATVAAGFRPLLGMLLAVAVYFSVSSLNLRQRSSWALALLMLVLLSRFGLLGFFLHGKDSIYGILLGMCFLASLCRREEDVCGIELGILFAAAVLTGIVTFPYLLVAYVLWAMFVASRTVVVDTAGKMLLINTLSVPIAFTGFFGGLSFGLAFLAYCLVGLLLLWSIPRLSNRFFAISPSRYLPFLPVALFLPIPFLFPAEIPVALDVSWSGEPSELRKPLDGETEFHQYFFAYTIQHVTIAMGLLSSLVIGFLPLGRERGGLIVVASMPLAVLLLMLVRIHTHIPVLSGFNVWDLVKDIPMWFGGTLYAFLAVALLASTLAMVSSKLLRVLLLLPAMTLLLYWPTRSPSLAWLRMPVTYTQVGGSFIPVQAVLADFLWKEGRLSPVFVDPSIVVLRQYFYANALYGAYPVRHFGDIPEEYARHERFTAAVHNQEIRRFVKFAQEHNYALRHEAYLPGTEASLLVLWKADKPDVRILPDLPQVFAAHGIYNVEEHPLWGRFRWVSGSSIVSVHPASLESRCLELAFFDPRASDGVERALVVTSPRGREYRVSLHASAPGRPARLRLEIDGSHPTSEFHITADYPEFQFRNDPRKVAFGIQWPPELSTAGQCDLVD